MILTFDRERSENEVKVQIRGRAQRESSEGDIREREIQCNQKVKGQRVISKWKLEEKKNNIIC